MLHSAIVVTGGTLLSRLLGFARDASIAWILGGIGNGRRAHGGAASAVP